MRKRRVQAVLLRQKLREVFVVVLHFEKSNLGCSRLKKKRSTGTEDKPKSYFFFKKKEYSSYVITEWCVSAAQTALCMWLSDGCVAAAGCSVLTFRVLRGSLRPAAELLSAPLADWN